MVNSQGIVDKILGKKDVTLLGKKSKGKVGYPKVEKEFEDADDLYEKEDEYKHKGKGKGRHCGYGR
jgi:hypothetical protein